MEELFKDNKIKYDNEKDKIWSECEAYIAKYQSKSRNDEIYLRKGNYKIPRTKKITQYTFYNHSNRNVVGKDDPKLRYIPYIEDASDL